MIDLTTTVATLRAIAGVAKEANKIELYQQVLELQQRIMEAVAENTELVAKNAELTREVIALRARLDEIDRAPMREPTFVFRDDAYWQTKGDELVDGPFCPRCKDADKKVIRMTDRKNGFTGCVECKHAIRTPGSVEPERGPLPPRRSGWVRGY